MGNVRHPCRVFHQVEVVGSLSPNQQAKLLLEPDSDALESEALIINIFESLTGSPEGLEQFFAAFSNISVQVKIFYGTKEDHMMWNRKDDTPTVLFEESK